MSFIMTATPVHMHHIEHHSLEDTKWVIQSHVIAMYLPSLISGYLIAAWVTPASCWPAGALLPDLCSGAGGA